MTDPTHSPSSPSGRTIIQTFTTPLNACGMQWAPNEDPSSKTLLGLIAGYQLFPKDTDPDPIHAPHAFKTDDGSKAGHISLYTLSSASSTPTVTPLIDTPALPAVFDAKWTPSQDSPSPPIMAACADGSLRALSVPDLKQISSVVLPWEGEDAESGDRPALLHIEFHGPDAQVVLSDAAGGVSLWSWSPQGTSEPVCTSRWKAHDYEAWIATPCPTSPTTVWSGGDDAALKAWDSRAPVAPSWVNRSTHQAGVTSIAWHPSAPHIVATGSYDDTLRIWDDRMMPRKGLMKEEYIGGGLWRLRWHPSRPDTLAIAAMYEGFKLVHIDSLESSPEITTHLVYPDQGSIAYGLDWTPSGTILGSAAFYTSSFHVWSPDFEVTAEQTLTP